MDKTTEIIPNGLPFPFGTKKKSEGRRLLENLCPNAFISGVDAHFTIALEDSIQIIKNVANSFYNPARQGGTRINGRTLVKKVKSSADYYLNKTGCLVYVMMFDKANKVPLSKGDTQSNRDLKGGNDSVEEETIDLEDEESEEKKPKPKKEKPVMNYETIDGIAHKERRPYLSLDRDIPADWEIALMDREGTSRHIIGWICHQLLFGDEECRVEVPVGKHIIIDGHCLDEPWVSSQCHVLQKDNPKNLSTEICYVPIMKYVTEHTIKDGIYNPPLERTALVYEMYNELGEADFVIPFYISKLWNFFPSMESVVFGVFSNDTDILYYCSLQLEKMKGMAQKSSILSKYSGVEKTSTPKINVIWRYFPGPGWAVYSSYLQTRDFKFVDIKRLCDIINNVTDEKYIPPYIVRTEPTEVSATKKKTPTKPKVKKDVDNWFLYLGFVHKMNMPLQNILLALMAAGSDYTKGYYGITHETFFKAMILYYDYIKDLPCRTKDESFSWTAEEPIDSAAYIRLVKVAFMVSKQKKYCKTVKLIQGTSVQILKPDEYDYVKLCGAVSDLIKKNHFPSPEFVLCSYLHFSFYIKMVIQIGDNIIKEPSLQLYCYYKRCEEKGWIKDNTQKVFTLNRAWTIKET